MKLNDKDVKRAKELLNYHWFQKKEWQEEIKRMLATGLKDELDALANKDFRYLSKTYLPQKLKERDWLAGIAGERSGAPPAPGPPPGRGNSAPPFRPPPTGAGAC